MDLPALGKHFIKDEVFGPVEAVKTTSDLFMPLSGELVEINKDLKDNAGYVNTDSYTKGWMIKVRLSNISETASLLTATAYKNLAS